MEYLVKIRGIMYYASLVITENKKINIEKPINACTVMK